MYSLYLSDGQQISLRPTDVTVKQGQYAEFICIYSCTIHQTYSIFWVVGTLPGLNRMFSHSRTSSFIEDTGLYVEVSKVVSCEGSEGSAMETIRINGSSADSFNGTAIQCVAYSTIVGQTLSIYSRFSVMLINGMY